MSDNMDQLQAALDAYVNKMADELLGLLGESPEAVRGARVTVGILSTIVSMGVNAAADNMILLTTQLAMLNKLGEVLGGR